MSGYLADTSAWVVSRPVPDLRERFATLLVGGAVASCRVVEGELLYSTQNGREFRMWRESLEAMPQAPVDDVTWTRALDVWALLADKGGTHHRQVKLNDVLVAAAAERTGLTVLHYDQDFDVIAKVTGQPTEWIAPRGSLGD
jgi:predicted nucleic acid-binding protein